MMSRVAYEAVEHPRIDRYAQVLMHRCISLRSTAQSLSATLLLRKDSLHNRLLFLTSLVSMYFLGRYIWNICASEHFSQTGPLRPALLISYLFIFCMRMHWQQFRGAFAVQNNKNFHDRLVDVTPSNKDPGRQERSCHSLLGNVLVARLKCR